MTKPLTETETKGTAPLCLSGKTAPPQYRNFKSLARWLLQPFSTDMTRGLGFVALALTSTAAAVAHETNLDAGCASSTALLQAAVDAAAAAGGAVVRISCGFHAIGPLSLHGGVTLDARLCAAAPPGTAAGQLTLGACAAEQMHILHIAGNNVTVAGVRFDCANLTLDTNRDMAAVHTVSAVRGLTLQSNRFLRINTTSQGFHAAILSDCTGCSVRDNFVSQSGGDALNFNAGEYLISGNTVQDTGDGCIALNNNAFGVVSNNILRRCNLGIGAGPAGAAATANASTPFVITGNLIEDSDFGVLLGWFAYNGRLGPVNCIVSSNIIRRCRSAAIQNNGAPGQLGGAWLISDNQITHTGFPASPPPHTAAGPGAGHGIVAATLHDVAIRGNLISHGRGDAIAVESTAHCVITGNIVSADPQFPFGEQVTGIAIRNDDDVLINGNTARGFGSGIAVTGTSDRVQVTGNSVDAAGGAGVAVARAVLRVLVSGNTISNAPSEPACVAVDGPPSASRVNRDNLCW